MKIISQSSAELTLKEGSTQGIVVGSVLVVAAALGAIFLREANPYIIWIALAAACVGIGVILFSSSITVTANKTTGQVLYQKKRIVGGQDSTYSIADIFRIETRKQWQVQNTPPQPNQPMPQPTLVAQSVIVFKDGRELALDHQKSSSTTRIGPAVLMGGQGAESAIAAQVAQFLNVPFQEIAPPPMAGVIQF
jgi:Tfp pilus assembly PilM family ATPase